MSFPLDRKDRLLKGSPVFCMFPWVTMEIRPNGDVRPCYPYMDTERVGNVRDAPLADIWNSPEMRRLRLRMLAEEPSPECRHCYRLEKAGMESFRQVCNKNYAHDFHLTLKTRPDGGLPGRDVRHLALWLSNTCNFKCRMCWPKLSTSWYEDAKATGLWPVPDGVQRPLPNPEDLMAQIEPLLDGVEEVFFAGGEPLVIEEHYRVLDLLMAKRLFHVKLNYTTNFSLLHLKEKDIAKIWNQFKNVYVCASLDGMGKRGEYLRKGQRWDQIEKNRERIRAACPRVQFQVTCTISAMNAWHVPDFHADWLRKGYIGSGDFLIDILTGPDYLNVGILPPKLKEEISRKYRRHVEEVIRPAFGPGSKDEDRFLGVAEALKRRHRPYLIPAFLEAAEKLDKQRGESLFDVFPELRELLEFQLTPESLEAAAAAILETESSGKRADSVAEAPSASQDLVDIYRLQYRMLKNASSAAEPLLKILDICPSDHWARVELARTQKRLGRLDDAVASYRKAADAAPDAPEPVVGLLNIYLDEEMLPEARLEAEKLQKYLDRRPEDKWARVELARARSRLGRPDLLEKLLRQDTSWKGDRELARAGHSDLGDAFFKQGRLDESIVEYRNALDADPDFAEAHAALANIYFQKGMDVESRMEMALASRRRG